jgi:hypothetical protein
MEYVDKLGRRHYIMAGNVGTAPGPYTPFFTVRRGRADQEEPIYRRDADDPSWPGFASIDEANQEATAKAVEWIVADANAAGANSGP